MMMEPPERPRVRDVAIRTSHPSHMSNSRLHGFSLPELSWGSQKMLRCFRITESIPSRIGDCRSLGLSDHADFGQRPPVGQKAEQEEEEEEDLKALRAKLMVHYDVAVEKIEKAGSRDDKEVAPAVRPWNLRTRRAACNAPEENGRTKNSVAAEGRSRAAGRRRTFSLELTKEEIEEDFLSMIGGKPAKRPKKRPRKIQHDLDMLLPGMGLPYISADTYKVSEGKKK